MGNARADAMVSSLTASGGLVDFGPDHSRLLIKVMRSLATGRPVTGEQVDQFIAEIGITQGEADQFLRARSERDADENIVGLLGLSLNDHQHRFTVNGTQMSAWCAYDTLFLPVLLQKTATVESPSHLSKEPVRLTVSPTGVRDTSPAGAVLSMVIIDPGKTDMGSTKAIWGNFCHQIFFFASRQEAEQWAAGRDDIEILSVQEGFELGKQMWSTVLAYGRSGQASGGADMSESCCPTPSGKAAGDPSQGAEVDTCCEFHPPIERGPGKCPSCGALGRPVQRLTVGAMLKPECRPQIPHQDAFSFCRTADCDVVYFRPKEVLFRKDDVRVPVHQKEPDDPSVPVCYCFDWTPEKVRTEIERAGRSTALEQIAAQVKADNCYCEVTNPQGACCLGNVARVANQMMVSAKKEAA